MAYLNVLADVLSSVAGSVIPPGAEPSRNVLMTAVTCFGALPIALCVRSPQVRMPHTLFLDGRPNRYTASCVGGARGASPGFSQSL